MTASSAVWRPNYASSFASGDGLKLDAAVTAAWLGSNSSPPSAAAAGRREADLDGQIDDAYQRSTIRPMRGGEDDERTYRLYFGATSDAPVNGMFSYVPCQPPLSILGFARPILGLGDVLPPNLTMAASVLDIGADGIAEAGMRSCGRSLARI